MALAHGLLQGERVRLRSDMRRALHLQLGVDLSKPPQRGITQEQLDRLKAIGASRESAERALREALDARQREARGELDRQKRA